jgi:hypothetical protein
MIIVKLKNKIPPNSYACQKLKSYRVDEKGEKKSNAFIKYTCLVQVLPKIYKEWPPHVRARNLRH